MINNTPINEFKLTSNGRRIFEMIKKWENFKTQKIHINKKDYDVLLASVAETERHKYVREMPLGEKILIRG